MAIHYIPKPEPLAAPPLHFSGPQWQLAARYLGHALQCGTSAEKRAAYRRLQQAPDKWTEFLFPDVADSDALGRVRWAGAHVSGRAKWCIATIASAGYGAQLDDLFVTLRKFGNVGDAQLAVMVVGRAPDVLQVCAKHDAAVVHCSAVAPVGVSTKAALYSIAQVLTADYYLCFDTDILCVDKLDELRAQIENARGCVVAAMSYPSTGAEDRPRDLEYVTRNYYWGTPQDARWLNGGSSVCSGFLRLNAGVFGGDRAAMLMLDSELYMMSARAQAWIASGICYAADELVFSVAVAHIGGVSECDTRYNWLMYAQDARARNDGFWSDEKRIALLHFAAPQGKAKLPHYRIMLGLPKLENPV